MIPLTAHVPVPLLNRLLDERRSVRAYRAEDVPDALLRELMTTARRAPSAANLQPGRFTRVVGHARQQLTDALLNARRSGRIETEDYDYFPQPMPQYLRRRQVASAQALYGALQIERADRSARDQQFDRNFTFFDAPVALLLTVDRRFGAGGYLDLGMLLYGLMLAAESAGLATCAIGALASYPDLIRATLGWPDDQAIVCGVALGYPCRDTPGSVADTARIAVDDFFTTQQQ